MERLIFCSDCSKVFKKEQSVMLLPKNYSTTVFELKEEKGDLIPVQIPAEPLLEAEND